MKGLTLTTFIITLIASAIDIIVGLSLGNGALIFLTFLNGFIMIVITITIYLLVSDGEDMMGSIGKVEFDHRNLSKRIAKLESQLKIMSNKIYELNQQNEKEQ